ncbi:MAG: hypothetical protein IID44_07310 [Planctomycetes bacterium]|nr:hypothetical protein [Planctomycetota bacterium]
MLARTCLSLLFLAAVGLSTTMVSGQDPAPQPKSQPKSKTASAKSRSPVGPPIRSLARGVETTIPVDRDAVETTSSHFPPTVLGRDIDKILRSSNHQVVEILRHPDLLKWKPNFSEDTLEGMAANMVYRRKIWYLEFTFKPLRMMWIDIPQPSGKMTKKLIWYLVFRVKNTGDQLEAVKDTQGAASPTLAEWTGGDKDFKKTAITAETAYKDAFRIVKSDGLVRFLPRFVLHSEEYDKGYLDRVIPAAIPAIQQREDPKRKLLSTVEISSRPIPLSKGREDNSVWGVATWTDSDKDFKKMDKFSIYVEGLTNAYRWQDRDEQNPKPRPLDRPKIVLRDKDDKPIRKPLRHERVLRHKTLRLRFWRPGDEFYQSEREIRYGGPPSEGKGTLDYEWVWR